MDWKLIVLILLIPLYALYWVAIEPLLILKNKGVKRYRLQIGLTTSLIFLDALLLLLNVAISSVLIFSGIVILGILSSINLLFKEEEESVKVDIKERDLILWEGENLVVKSVGKNFIMAISESGEYMIPVQALLIRGVKKLRKVLPRKVEFSLFFPVEIYTNLLKKLEDFLRNCTHVLVSPEFQIEFVSVALNEVEVKVTFFTENLKSEQAFWDEFFNFLDKEKLSINRISKHGEGQTHGW